MLSHPHNLCTNPPNSSTNEDAVSCGLSRGHPGALVSDRRRKSLVSLAQKKGAADVEALTFLEIAKEAEKGEENLLAEDFKNQHWARSEESFERFFALDASGERGKEKMGEEDRWDGLDDVIKR
jgi:hypothetical protein